MKFFNEPSYFPNSPITRAFSEYKESLMEAYLQSLPTTDSMPTTNSYQKQQRTKIRRAEALYKLIVCLEANPEIEQKMGILQPFYQIPVDNKILFIHSLPERILFKASELRKQAAGFLDLAAEELLCASLVLSTPGFMFTILGLATAVTPLFIIGLCFVLPALIVATIGYSPLDSKKMSLRSSLDKFMDEMGYGYNRNKGDYYTLHIDTPMTSTVTKNEIATQTETESAFQA